MKTLIAFPFLLLAAQFACAQQYTVVNKCDKGSCQQYTVVDKTAPTNPNQPAPNGYKWIKYGNAPWKLEAIATAPGVAAPRPFTQGTVTVTNPTTAPSADGHSTPWTGSTVTVPTGTGAPTTGPFGTTNGGCANGNCAVPTQSSGGLFRRR